MERLDVLRICDGDPLKITEFVVDRWALNPITFIEQFGYIFNPKFNNSVKPLFLFDYQKKILIRIWQNELSGKENEILIDKPREMGLTWILVWYCIWRWLFTPNWSVGILSRKEDEVDDGTSEPGKAIFGKIRWGLQHLPGWLMPTDFQFKGKKGTSTDKQMYISNPQMSSSMVGSTANENAFRGSRFSMSWVDECFFIERFLAVQASISAIADTRVYCSTSKVGRSYQKYVEGKEKEGNHIALTYKDNPFKDEIWHEQKIKEAEYNPEALREVDVSYAVNTTMQYYPEIVKAKVSPVNYDRKRPLFVSLDYGRQDHTVLIWWQFDGTNFNILECVAKNKVNFEWFTPFLNKDLAYDESLFIGYFKELINKIRSWEKPKGVFGEPAHKQVHYPSNSSIQKELAKFGIRLLTNDNACSYEVRRTASSIILPKCVFNQDSSGVMELYDCIQNSRYAGTVKGSSKESLMKPAHDDEVGDYRSAFENGAVNVPRVLRLQRGEISETLKQRESDGTNVITSLIKYLKI